jgi:hypothetical protein
MNNIRTVPKLFIKYNHEFTQLKRVKDLAIYERKSLSKNEVYKGYEVVRIKTTNGGTMNGLEFGPAEVYPSDDQWGMYGFTEQTLDSAEKRFKQLVAKV